MSRENLWVINSFIGCVSDWRTDMRTHVTQHSLLRRQIEAHNWPLVKRSRVRFAIQQVKNIKNRYDELQGDVHQFEEMIRRREVLTREEMMLLVVFMIKTTEMVQDSIKLTKSIRKLLLSAQRR